MNERERRAFNAGLSDEVDAWLRGDTSRRSFLTKFMLMGGAAMLPGFGFTAASFRSLGRGGRHFQGRTRGQEHADGPGPGGGGQGLDRGAGRRVGVSRGASGESYEGQEYHAQYDLRGRASGARAQEFLRAVVAGAHRHELQRRRTAAPRPVFQADRRAHRQFRRLRHSRYRAGMDPRARQRRRHCSDRRLCRQVHEPGRPRRLPSAIQVDYALQGQALGRVRRRRSVGALLPQGHFRRSQAEVGLPSQIRQGARGAGDVGRLFAGRAIHHRSARAQCLWRRAFPQVRQPRKPVQFPAAVPRQRWEVLRRRDEGAIDDGRRGRQRSIR